MAEKRCASCGSKSIGEGLLTGCLRCSSKLDLYFATLPRADLDGDESTAQRKTAHNSERNVWESAFGAAVAAEAKTHMTIDMRRSLAEMVADKAVELFRRVKR